MIFWVLYFISTSCNIIKRKCNNINNCYHSPFTTSHFIRIMLHRQRITELFNNNRGNDKDGEIQPCL